MLADQINEKDIPIPLQIAFLLNDCLLNMQNLAELPLHSSGIYFLIDGEEVVYIGQSINPLSRIGDHLRNKDGKFDRCFFIPVPRSILDLMESNFIKALSPKLNGNSGPSVGDNDERPA